MTNTSPNGGKCQDCRDRSWYAVTIVGRLALYLCFACWARRYLSRAA